MKITKLEYQKKNPNHVNVYVDGEFVAGIGANDVLSLGLFKDLVLTKGQLAKITSVSEFGKLFNKALNFLAYRPRSEWEIRQKLRRENPEQVKSVIERLRKIGQVDDEAFTKWFVDQRQTFRPKGRRAIEFELRRKGVKAKVESDISEVELAKKAATRMRDEVTPERLQRFLASRGFDWDTIKETVAAIIPKGYNNDVS